MRTYLQRLDPDAGMALLTGLPVTSPATVGAMGLMAAKDHAARFPVRLVEKDLRYAVEAGAGPVIEAVRQRYLAAIAAGWSDQNLTVVHELDP